MQTQVLKRYLQFRHLQNPFRSGPKILQLPNYILKGQCNCSTYIPIQFRSRCPLATRSVTHILPVSDIHALHVILTSIIHNCRDIIYSALLSHFFNIVCPVFSTIRLTSSLPSTVLYRANSLAVAPVRAVAGTKIRHDTRCSKAFRRRL